jgi:hypothetical protein
MFDIYLSKRRDLLVLRTGHPIPPTDTSIKWRKTRKKVVSVSEEIRAAIEQSGYYVRKAGQFKPQVRKSLETIERRQNIWPATAAGK